MSMYPCIDCEVHKDDLYSTQVQSIPRTHERHIATLNSNFQQAEDRLGYARLPLTGIPYGFHLPENLHLFNRISDMVFVNFISDLMGFDRITDQTVFNSTVHVNVNKFFSLVKERARLNILAQGVSLSSIKDTFKSLTGGQRDQIFANIQIIDHFLAEFERLYRKTPPPPLGTDEVAIGRKRCRQINSLWVWIYQIKLSLSNYDQTPVEPDSLARRNKAWCNMYVSLYGARSVTPSIHRFSNHLADYYRNHGDVNRYNAQGVEKSHHFIRNRYLNASNRIRGRQRTCRFLSPLLKHSLRVAYFEKTFDYRFDCDGNMIFNWDDLPNELNNNNIME